MPVIPAPPPAPPPASRYDRDCPTCGGPIVRTCRCRKGDSWCDAGHASHNCSVCGCVHPWGSAHAGGRDCVPGRSALGPAGSRLPPGSDARFEESPAGETEKDESPAVKEEPEESPGEAPGAGGGGAGFASFTFDLY